MHVNITESVNNQLHDDHDDFSLYLQQCVHFLDCQVKADR